MFILTVHRGFLAAVMLVVNGSREMVGHYHIGLRYGTFFIMRRTDPITASLEIGDAVRPIATTPLNAGAT